MSKATEAALAALHGAVANELTRRIKDNEATAADLGAAIKFLKDNHITASIEDNQALSDLKQKLGERLAKREPPVLSTYLSAAPSICATGRIVYLGTPQSVNSIYNTLPGRGYTVRIWTGRFPTPAQIESYGDLLAPWITRKLADAERFPLLLIKVQSVRVAGDLFPMTIQPGLLMQETVAYEINGTTYKLAVPSSISDERAKLQGTVMFVDPAGGYSVDAFKRLAGAGQAPGCRARAMPCTCPRCCMSLLTRILAALLLVFICP